MAQNLAGWIICGAAMALVAGEASACSLPAQNQPLNLTPEQIDAAARRLLDEPGTIVAEAVVLRSTGGGGPGLLRIDRVLRGDAPATLQVSVSNCGYGFVYSDRGIVAYTDRHPPRHFVHRQIEEAMRRIAASE